MTNAISILFLDRDKFDFFNPATNTVLRFELPQTSVSDLEIIDASELETKIGEFIKTNSIAPSQIIIVLSDNMCFVKDIKVSSEDKIPPEATGAQMQQFVDSVPFEYVATKVYPIPNGNRVVVVNKQIQNTLKTIFGKMSFSLDIVVPLFSLGVDSVSVSSGLSQEIISAVFKDINVLRQNNLLIREEPFFEKTKELNSPDVNNNGNDKKSNTKLFIFIGIFSLLFLILGVVLFLQR